MGIKCKILMEVERLIDEGFTSIDIKLIDDGFIINPSKIIDNREEDSHTP